MLKPPQQSLLRRLALASCLCAFVVQLRSSTASAQETAGRLLRTDSRAGYLHKLTLYDRDGQAINPDDKSPKPYSPKITCGKCHEYGLINHGWHFNAGLPEEPMAEQGSGNGNQPLSSGGAAESSIQNPNSKIQNPTSIPQSEIRNPQFSFASPGRPGEPWIFTDPDSGTQIPLSYREWPGTFRPADLGLTPWKFVQTFGRHLPGGGIFDPDAKTSAAQPEAARWKISGGLEIDCMVCHAGAGSGYDAGEIARQVARENLAWIPTAALGLGVIRGDAKKVPDDFDPDAIIAPDQTGAKLPEVAYNKSLFDADQRVFFDIVKDPPAERCYFCHSVREVGTSALKTWEHQADVHLAAGLNCSDCHANGIDHAISRGFFQTGLETGTSAALTCQGCHLGISHAGDPTIQAGGRFRAPKPQHAGIPPLHFDHLACTSCHSGPWPGDEPKRIQTSQAHGLGVSTKERHEDDGPVVFQPLFANSRTEYEPVVVPWRLLWPAYWAKRVDGKLTPLAVDAVQKAAKKVLQRAKKKSDAHGPMTDAEIVLLLKPLAAQFAKDSAREQVVYVRDGNAYTLGEGDKLQRELLADQRPYLWPLAHDVRPARQALGARGCTDCHAADSPMFFGKLAATAQVPGTPLLIASMAQLINYEPRLASSWAAVFRGRTAFKILALLSSLFMALVLLRKTVLAGVHLAPTMLSAHSSHAVAFAKTRICWRMLAAQILVLLGILGGAATSLSGFFSIGSRSVAGSELQLHMFAAPIFIAGLVLTALLWACDRPDRHGHGTFWNLTLGVALLAGLIATATIVASMSPFFGYDAQRLLLAIHRWSSLIVLIAFPLHWLGSLAFKPRPEQPKIAPDASPG